MIKNFIVFLLMITTFSNLSYAIIVNKEEPIYYFTNHEEQINSLREKLVNTKKVGIIGITGIGKSELVRKYVQEYQYEYSIIGFLDLSVNLTPQLITIAKEINKQVCYKKDCYISEDPKDVKNSLIEYLKNQDKWLLIFDNLHVNENDKIKDIIDWKHKGHIIICSQDDKYLLSKILVPYLNIENTSIIINKIMKDQSPEFILELAKSLQGYPTYMIGHSAIFLQNNNHMTINEYIKNMEKYDNKIKAHLEIVLIQLTQSGKNLLYNMVLLNNQKIPRYLLETLIIDKHSITDALAELVRFGLIEQINENRNDQVFRIHDAVTNELLNIVGKKLNQNNINLLLDKFNNYIPEAINKRLTMLKNLAFLESNLEILLRNADKYNADACKVMELREKLLWYYLIGQRQPNNAKKLIDWFEGKQISDKLWFHNNKDKAVYSGYLVFISLYKYAMDNQPIKVTMPYLEKAEKIMQKVAGYQELKSYIYANKAILQIAVGDIRSAEENIIKADQVRPDVLKTFLGMNLVETIKAEIFLAKGKYQEALNILVMDIDKLYSTVDRSAKGRFLASEYIIQAMILNYMNRFTESYNIIYNYVYKNIKHQKKGNTSSFLVSRTLTELSRAELGLGMQKEALNHAKEAVNILISDASRNNKLDDLDNSKDVYLANALVAKGNVLSFSGKPEEAMATYILAKNIYLNIYGIHNIGNMDNAGYLFAQAVKTTKNLVDKKDNSLKCFYFYGMLVKHFGEKHPRTQEVQGLCN